MEPALEERDDAAHLHQLSMHKQVSMEPARYERDDVLILLAVPVFSLSQWSPP